MPGKAQRPRTICCVYRRRCGEVVNGIGSKSCTDKGTFMLMIKIKSMMCKGGVCVWWAFACICKFSDGGEGEKEGKTVCVRREELESCRAGGLTCRFTDKQT